MKNKQNLLYEPKIKEIQFPLFKFLKSDHAKDMLQEGKIYIPNLYSFKKNRFGGLIDDNTEGEVCIENHYESFDGYAEDVESMMLLTFGAGKKKLVNVTLKNEIKNPDALIYCTSSFLFSDTLSWAIKEGKESCIMISDSQLFFNLIYEKLKHKYPLFKFGSCLYVKSDEGIYYEPNANKNSLTNEIMHDRFMEFFLKPKNFSSQREVRAIFRNNSESINDEIEPETLIIPEIRKLLFEIDFKNADVEILTERKKGRINMINVLKSGDKHSVCFETPFNLMTPLIFNQNVEKIGFSTPYDKKFVGGNIIGEPALYLSSIGTPIFACSELNNLSYIELNTE